MEIKELYVKNFRNIGEEGATIKLSPVTIFTGCNSAGKSTVAKVMLLLDSYLLDIKSNNRQLFDTPLVFSKVGKLGSFDSVLNKEAKAKGHDEIMLGYSFASAILATDIQVYLIFGKKETDPLNYGWLKELSIRIDSSEILNICINDGVYRLDIKDKQKFVEYFRCYKIRHLVSFWREHEERCLMSQIYSGSDSTLSEEVTCSQNEIENFRFKMPELLEIEETLVKEGIIRDRLWNCDVDDSFKESVGLLDVVSAIENIVVFGRVDYIIYDVEKSKGSRLTHDDIDRIFDEIKALYVSKHGEEKGVRFYNSNRDKCKDKDYILSYIDSEYQSFPEFKRGDAVICEFLEEFNNQDYQETPKNISMSQYNRASIIDIIDIICGLGRPIELFLRYILKRAFDTSFCGRLKYVDASTVDVRRLYPLDSSDSFGNLWMRYNEIISNSSREDCVHSNFMKSWLQRLGICEDIIVENVEGSLRIKLVSTQTPEGRPLADYGYGVTQFIALLLNIEIAINNVGHYTDAIVGWPFELDSRSDITVPYWLILEEPEVHLHPKIQSQLADLFLDASQRGLRFIVETHSEYLVRRTQVLVSARKFNEDNIDEKNAFRVYYFPTKGVPYDMKYLPSGRFECKFGEGFFDEAARSHMEILKREKSR